MIHFQPASAASLIGSDVSGVLTFEPTTLNWFDPATLPDFVPGGFGNSTSPNNVVIGSEVEFGFVQPNANTDTVDFNADSVTLQDVTTAVGASGSASFVITLTDPQFLGATVSLVSDNFKSTISETLVGDVLTLSEPEFSGGGTFDATYDITPVSATPLPGALPLFASALGAIGLLARRRKQKSVAATPGA